MNNPLTNSGLFSILDLETIERSLWQKTKKQPRMNE